MIGKSTTLTSDPISILYAVLYAFLDHYRTSDKPVHRTLLCKVKSAHNILPFEPCPCPEQSRVWVVEAHNEPQDSANPALSDPTKAYLRATFRNLRRWEMEGHLVMAGLTFTADAKLPRCGKALFHGGATTTAISVRPLTIDIASKGRGYAFAIS